ncbi:MAG: hypothetical protein K2N41_03720 [Lachnospiraceae bacterium]|nr:hypothetical protein [Lachnospiraceae bacterium]MDE7238803.1 hypothetical protein [Lachnospiraceae bacterium]
MKKGFVIIVTTVALICFSVLIAAPIVNDHMAKKTAKELADLPLPNNTELIESVYKAGKLVGNGNGMQYFGAILIKSDLSLEELQEYYSGFAESEWKCIVENQTDKKIRMVEHTRLTFQSDIEGDHYYIVYSWGENHTIFHELDLRGH